MGLAFLLASLYRIELPLEIINKKKQKKQNKPWAVILPLMLTTAILVDVIEPVDQIKEGECDWEDDSRPLVYGVDVREVWDLDFELGGPPPQAALLVSNWPV